MSRARLEFFSDAVLAVAITMLALNIWVAGPGHGPLSSVLSHEWRPWVAYLISFFTIGVVWVNHHALVSNVRVVDRGLLFFNIVLLVFVVQIPVATRLLADYLSVGGPSARLAAVVYGATHEGMAVGYILMLEWILRDKQTQPPIPSRRRLTGRLKYYSAHVLYLTVIGCAFISPMLSLALSAVTDVYYVFKQTPLRPMRTAQRSDAAAPPPEGG
jgi:uncharacterized membrane protein